MQYQVHQQLDQGTIIANRYIIDIFISRDQLGTNHRAIDQQTSGFVMLKTINLDQSQLNENQKTQIQRYIQLWMKIDCQNVIHLGDAFQNDKMLIMIYEYCQQGSLRDYIQKSDNKRLGQTQALKFMNQIINGLRNLHRMNIIHRGLSVDSIFISDGQCKIGEFTLCKEFQQQDEIQQSQTCKVNYSAPESDNNTISTLIDMYGLGYILYEMLYNRHPFSQNGVFSVQMLQKQKQEIIDFTHPQFQITECVKQLIVSMFKYNVKDRIDWVRLSEHQAFSEQNGYELIPNFRHIDRNNQMPESQLNPIPQQNNQQGQEQQQQQQSQSQSQLQKASLSRVQQDLLEKSLNKSQLNEQQNQQFQIQYQSYEYQLVIIEYMLNVTNLSIKSVRFANNTFFVFIVSNIVKVKAQQLLNEIQDRKYTNKQTLQLQNITERLNSMISTLDVVIEHQYLKDGSQPGIYFTDLENKNIQQNYDEEVLNQLKNLKYEQDLDFQQWQNLLKEVIKVYYWAINESLKSLRPQSIDEKQRQIDFQILQSAQVENDEKTIKKAQATSLQQQQVIPKKRQFFEHWLVKTGLQNLQDLDKQYQDKYKEKIQSKYFEKNTLDVDSLCPSERYRILTVHILQITDLMDSKLYLEGTFNTLDQLQTYIDNQNTFAQNGLEFLFQKKYKNLDFQVPVYEKI